MSKNLKSCSHCTWVKKQPCSVCFHTLLQVETNDLSVLFIECSPLIAIGVTAIAVLDGVPLQQA